MDSTIIDGDDHELQSLNGSSDILNEPKAIHIGNNCWLGAQTSILKGVNLADGTILPYGSTIIESYNNPNSIFGGKPNKVLKQNVARRDFYPNVGGNLNLQDAL
ncbi:hypothetical protein [Marseilla massiliensis]|uniref:hypothetical protein n=1 Tax=Marseilla massiliensis TaxID=1841864 RepID=UPI001EF74AD6|nr:hypothetical protein [Marseilla massiliensis]